MIQLAHLIYKQVTQVLPSDDAEGEEIVTLKDNVKDQSKIENDGDDTYIKQI